MQIAGWMGRALRAALVVCLAAGSAAAQGVTTGSMGASSPTRRARSCQARPSSRFTSPRERPTRPSRRRTAVLPSSACASAVPYKVTAALAGFGTQTQDASSVTLGTSTDLTFTLSVAAVTETGHGDGHQRRRCSARSARAPRPPVTRDELALLPTVSRPHQRHHPPDAAVRAATARSPARTTG